MIYREQIATESLSKIFIENSNVLIPWRDLKF